jgi:hypothetical protein
MNDTAPPNADLYERDFYSWTVEQATLLRAGKVADADIENIAEGIASIRRSVSRACLAHTALVGLSSPKATECLTVATGIRVAGLHEDDDRLRWQASPSGSGNG